MDDRGLVGDELGALGTTSPSEKGGMCDTRKGGHTDGTRHVTTASLKSRCQKRGALPTHRSHTPQSESARTEWAKIEEEALVKWALHVLAEDWYTPESVKEWGLPDDW